MWRSRCSMTGWRVQLRGWRDPAERVESGIVPRRVVTARCTSDSEAEHSLRTGMLGMVETNDPLDHDKESR